jgi:hypothetical protein
MNKVILFLFALTLGANIHATAQEAVNTSEIESIYAKAGFNYEHVNSMANQITQSEDPMAPGLAVSMLRTMESMKGAGAPVPMSEELLNEWVNVHGLTNEHAQDLYKVALRFALQHRKR